MDPEPWTQPHHHHGNSRYYTYFSLIYNQFSPFSSCFLFLDMDPEPWILSLWHHGNRKSHSIFLLILFWFSIIRYEPWTQPLQYYGNNKYHSYFFLIFFWFSGYYSGLSGSLSVYSKMFPRCWKVNESMNFFSKSSVDKEWVLLINS